MTIRSAPLLCAALALLAAPALAQDNAEEAAPAAADAPAPPAEGSAEAPSAEDTAAEPAEAPAAETQAATADPAPTAAGEPAPPLAPVPAPAATAPTAARAIPPSPFSPDQRNGWLAQCRSAFQRAGAVLGGGNGLPDACETQLTDFERDYVPSADGRPPVIFVRVPIVRAPAAAAAPVDADTEE